MQGTSPTQRSLKLLRHDGFLCHVTERWNGFAHVRQDAFGFGDILAVQDDRGSAYYGVWLVQVTSGANHAARVKKIERVCGNAATRWLAAGGRIAVQSWKKVRGRWAPRWQEVGPTQELGLAESPAGEF